MVIIFAFHHGKYSNWGECDKAPHLTFLIGYSANVLQTPRIYKSHPEFLLPVRILRCYKKMF